MNLGTLFDSELVLYDTDGVSELAYNDDYDDSYASRIVWAAPATGTYYVAVSGLDFEERGSYALTLAIWSGPVPTPEKSEDPTPTPVATRTPTPAPAFPGGSGDGQFRHPGAITVDGLGNVYVADGAIAGCKRSVPAVPS